MKNNEFKKILKPLIKQTIKEVILEEGILSNIVAEVAKGLQDGLIVETKSEKAVYKDHKKEAEMLEQQRQKRIKKLNESTKLKHDVFDNVKNIPEASAGDPLSDVAPTDAGVDISGIANLAGGAKKWKTLIGK